MKDGKLHDRSNSKNFRKFLRRRMTPAETYLWGFLKRKRLEGRKFRRQHGIGKYVVDFYCASERLVVELDGEVHFGDDQVADYDQERASYFEDLGLTVLRYENRYVFDYPKWVLEELKEHFRR